MTNISDADALKVHVGRDGIWCLQRDGMPQRLFPDAETFLSSQLLRNTEQVRLVGTRQNAWLITKLYGLREDDRLLSVQVATPLVCRTRAERDDPAIVLFMMRRCMQAPSCGGFHELTSADLGMYALIAALYEHGVDMEKIWPYLLAHPAWPVLAYVRTIDAMFAAQLLAHIVDPRWYVDPRKPERTSRLEASLGLTPHTQAGVSTLGHKLGHNHHGCLLTLRSWKQANLVAEITQIFQQRGVTPLADTDLLGLHPSDFTWRIWGYHRGFGLNSRETPSTPTMADLRASQAFVRFLRQVWLAAIYSDAVLPDGGRALATGRDLFTQHAVEAAAFDRHMLCLQQRQQNPSCG